MSLTSPVVLCMQNSVISTRITSVNESQTSPVVLCMQNHMISTRITSLHGSQISPAVLCKQNNAICIRIASLYVSQASPADFACKTATFGSELQVSIGPSPHLLFFPIHNSVIMTRINSLYRSQTSLVVVCMQNNEIKIRITSLYGSQPSSVVFLHSQQRHYDQN